MDSIKRVVVTGATGLLGTNLVNRLLAEGCEVLAIMRSPKKYMGDRSEHLQLIQGELFDDYSVVFKNADAVVHIAALTAQNIFSYEPYRKINFEATRHLYQTAVKAGIPRFLFISTANTCGFGTRDDPGQEDKPMKKPFTRSFYALSKKEAEDFLIAQEDDMMVKILCPTFMIGANDVKPSSGRIIRMGLNKKILFYPPGGKNFVGVDDVVQAIIQSFTLGGHKEKYVIAHENLSYRQFFEILNLVNRQNPLMVKVPAFVLKGVGYLGDILRKLKIKTDWCSTNMQSLCIENYYDNLKSRSVLQVVYTPVKEAVKKAVDYFKNDFPAGV